MKKSEAKWNTLLNQYLREKGFYCFYVKLKKKSFHLRLKNGKVYNLQKKVDLYGSYQMKQVDQTL